MYFRNRAGAGRQIAAQLTDYATKNVAVVALSPGAVIVGAQIAMKLHGYLMMLLTEDITLPGENSPLAAVSSDNTFTYNNKYSAIEIEEMKSEYLSVIEQQRREKLHKLHVLLGADGEIDRKYLQRHVIILVSDGLSNGFSLDVAAEFLKPVADTKLIVATPIASVTAVDRMHLLGDEIVCLDVLENYMDTNHYYDDNTIPDTKDLIKVIKNLPIHWIR
jgi:putative phosphoribosyl transferase